MATQMTIETSRYHQTLLDRLEEIQLKEEYKEMTEIIQLLSLQEEEIVAEFNQNAQLRRRYFPNEVQEENFYQVTDDAEVIQESEESVSEPETERISEEEEDFNANPVRFRDDGSFYISEDDIPPHKYRIYDEDTPSSSKNDFFEKKPNFPPKKFGIPTNGLNNNILDIDCITDMNIRKQMIDDWLTNLSLIIQSNPTSFEQARQVLILAEHHSRGNVQNFIKKIKWNETLSGSKMLDEITQGLYTMFLGLDYISNSINEQQKISQEAINIMTKAQLCDLCYLDQFTCLFEKNLGKLDPEEFPKWTEIYLRKIPVVGNHAWEEWKKEPSNPLKYSIAYATRLVKKEIARYCDFKNTTKQLKKFRKNCCNKYKEPNYLIGCTETSCKPNYKKKKSTRLKPKYKKKWVKKKKKFQPGKYFQKKPKGNQKPKTKYCPQGKKKCRCWICAEEGHYANECPSRQTNQAKVKLLLEAQQEDYIPIEDPYMDYLTVYTIEIVSDTETEDEDSE
nr:Capsid protein [Dahlia common mosaic virus]